MVTITLHVEGIPAPQGSKVRTRYGFRESSKRVAPWTAAVKAEAIIAGDRAGLLDALKPPYRVDVAFYITKPRRTKHTHPVAPTIGDLDKLIRSTLDALTQGGLLKDDRFVVALNTTKEWAGDHETPGAIITITEVGDD